MTSVFRSRVGRPLTLVSFGLLLSLTSACGSQHMPPASPVAPPAQMMSKPSAGADAPAPSLPQPARSKAPQGLVSSAPQQAKGEADARVKSVGMQQRLIFTAGLELEVTGGDISSTLDKVVDIASALGGYIANQDDTSVTVRVPSADFRAAMRQIEKQGDVVHRSVKAQDVTEEFHDIGVRLKSLLATRERLQKFLDRAKNIDEALRIEQQLARLNGQIDQLRGRLHFLEARAAFSTITVALRERPKAPVKVVKKKVAPPPPAAPSTVVLPIGWIDNVGVDNLLRVK